MHSGKKAQCILVKSDEIENRTPFYRFFLNPVYVAARSLRSNKNEIVKLWREKLMLMSPIVEQHEMVLFHDRWIQNQFKDQENVEEMQRRLHTKANTSNDWLTELVNEMLVSPDTPPTPEFNTERVTEALTELDFFSS